MVVSPITRPGRLNGAGDENALAWRLFAGEVLTYFHQMNVMMPLHRTRTIANGKSTTFPVTGTATASHHTAGESIYGTDDGQTSTYLSNIGTKEREIFVDDPLLSGVFVPNIDELKAHWDVRSVYAKEIAQALANKADKNVLATLYAAALANPITNGYSTMPVASKDIDITDASVGTNIRDGIYAAQELFDQYNIPKDSRYVVLRPKQYRRLAAVEALSNKDFTAGLGDTNKRELPSVAGFQLVMTNSFGSTDDSAVAAPGVKNDPFGGAGIGYNCDWRNCAGLAFQMQAVGTVKMKELAVESEYSMERQGHTILGKYIMGHGILRPECSLSLSAGAGPVGTGIF